MSNLRGKTSPRETFPPRRRLILLPKHWPILRKSPALVLVLLLLVRVGVAAGRGGQDVGKVGPRRGWQDCAIGWVLVLQQACQIKVLALVSSASSADG